MTDPNKPIVEQEALTEAFQRAFEAWKALPEDERNGDRPWIMGFNAGWEECEEAKGTAEKLAMAERALETIAELQGYYDGQARHIARTALSAIRADAIARGDHREG